MQKTKQNNEKYEQMTDTYWGVGGLRHPPWTPQKPMVTRQGAFCAVQTFFV